MPNISLNDALVNEILQHLGVQRKSPTLRYLNQLIAAYTRRVPWESVTRIIKRRVTPATERCPRWPVEFWRDALRFGTGGTCYESSLAFLVLLDSLGYQGYLTVNDMGTSRACHAAVIVFLNNRKYLVDVTIPVHCAVRINPNETVRRRTFFHTYTVRPDGDNLYQVERSAHPKRNAFTLIDLPVEEAAFQDVVTRDYEDTGHFLKSVVIVKLIGDRVWRFNSTERPYKLIGSNRNDRTIIVLSPHTLAHALARKFSLPEEKIAAALNYVENQPISRGAQLLSLTPSAGLSPAGGG